MCLMWSFQLFRANNIQKLIEHFKETFQKSTDWLVHWWCNPYLWLIHLILGRWIWYHATIMFCEFVFLFIIHQLKEEIAFEIRFIFIQFLLHVINWKPGKSSLLLWGGRHLLSSKQINVFCWINALSAEAKIEPLTLYDFSWIPELYMLKIWFRSVK